MDIEEQMAAQVVAEAEDIAAGRDPSLRKSLVRIHRGDTISYDQVDRAYTVEFMAGYAFACQWFSTSQVPVSEAKELAGIYRDTLPGGPSEEANHWLDAALFPSLLAHLCCEVTVYDGDEIKAERIAEYGEEWQHADFPARTFVWPGCSPFHDAFLLAVHHVTEG